VTNCQKSIIIMWTTCVFTGEPVIINHFVPLFDREQQLSVSQTVIGDDDDGDNNFLHDDLSNTTPTATLTNLFSPNDV